jgi:hypothetical protein
MLWWRWLIIVPITFAAACDSAQDMESLVHDYEVRSEWLEVFHCTLCKLPLSKTEALDIFIQGLKCEQNHRFYVSLKSPSVAAVEKCTLSKGSSQSDELSVIRDWLTNVELRSVLGDGLAEILRRIYEIKTDDIHVAYTPSAAHTYLIFKYCPLCTEPLEPYDQNDVWVQGMQCVNGHQFRMRNGIAFSIGDSQLIYLHEEMADGTLHWSIDWWLKNEGRFKKELHPQIKAILKQFQSTNSEQQSKPQ